MTATPKIVIPDDTELGRAWVLILAQLGEMLGAPPGQALEVAEVVFKQYAQEQVAPHTMAQMLNGYLGAISDHLECLTGKIHRLAHRYHPTLDWAQTGPTTWHTVSGRHNGRIVRRHETWWLYTTRLNGDTASPIHLDANITKAKRIAETALAEPWLLTWPADTQDGGT